MEELTEVVRFILEERIQRRTAVHTVDVLVSQIQEQIFKLVFVGVVRDSTFRM